MLAYQALHIVLEHSMVLRLGWNPKACEDSLQNLKQEILTHQSEIFQEAADLNIENPPQSEVLTPYDGLEIDEVEKNSEKYVQALSCLLDNENPRRLKLQHQYDKEAAAKLLSRYSFRISRLRQYDALRYFQSLKQKYLALHWAVVGRLQQQREIYSHRSGGSLIVYQLHHWHEQWCAKIGRLLELVLLNIALYPYLTNSKNERYRTFLVTKFPKEEQRVEEGFQILIDRVLKPEFANNPILKLNQCHSFEKVISSFMLKLTSPKNPTPAALVASLDEDPLLVACSDVLSLLAPKLQETYQETPFYGHNQEERIYQLPVRPNYFLDYCSIQKLATEEERRQQQLKWEFALSEFLSRSVMLIWKSENREAAVNKMENGRGLTPLMNSFEHVNLIYQTWIAVWGKRFNPYDTQCTEYTVVSDLSHVTMKAFSFCHPTLDSTWSSAMWSNASALKCLQSSQNTLLGCIKESFHQVFLLIKDGEGDDEQALSTLREDEEFLPIASEFRPYPRCQLLRQMIQLLFRVGEYVFRTDRSDTDALCQEEVYKYVEWECVLHTFEIMAQQLNRKSNSFGYKTSLDLIERQLLWLEEVLNHVFRQSKNGRITDKSWLCIHTIQSLQLAEAPDECALPKIRSLHAQYQEEMTEVSASCPVHVFCQEIINMLAKHLCLYDLRYRTGFSDDNLSPSSSTLKCWLNILMEVKDCIATDSEINVMETHLAIIHKLVSWATLKNFVGKVCSHSITNRTYEPSSPVYSPIGPEYCPTDEAVDTSEVPTNGLSWIDDQTNLAIIALMGLEQQLCDKTHEEISEWLVDAMKTKVVASMATLSLEEINSLLQDEELQRAISERDDYNFKEERQASQKVAQFLENEKESSKDSIVRLWFSDL